ncbi:MAG: hypothetical protein WC337_01675 [Candidatus Muiribacteriota bacterium]
MLKKLLSIILLITISIFINALPLEKTDKLEINLYRREIIQGIYRRNYYLYMPVKYTNQRKIPLLILLPPEGGDYNSILKTAQWKIKADTANFLILIPEAMPQDRRVESRVLSNPRIWNNNEEEKQYNDYEYIRESLEDVLKTYTIDNENIYIVGYSSSAQIAYNFSLKNHEHIKKIALISPIFFEKPEYSEKIPEMLIMHSKSKKEFKTISRTFFKNQQTLNGEEFIQNLTENNEIKLIETIYEKGGEINKYKHSEKQTSIKEIKIDNTGHLWYGGIQYLPSYLTGKDQHYFNATTETLDFFK